MSVGEILDVAFGVYRRHLATLVTLTVVLTGLPLVLFGAGAALVTPSLSGNVAGIAFLVLLFVVGYVLLSQLAMGASVLVIGEGYLGRDLAAGDAVRRTVGRLGPLLAAAFLVGLAVGLGFLLFVIPGVILLCGLVVTTQVVMLEASTGAGAAMGRAWSLSRGFRWRMLLLLLVSIVLSMVVMIGTNILVAIVMGVWPPSSPIPRRRPRYSGCWCSRGCSWYRTC